MFGLTVRFDLRAGSGPEFDNLVAETIKSIMALEPGTLVYVVHTVHDDPGARVFYELYRDRAAFDEHERQEHVRRFLGERDRYLAGPPRVEFLDLAAGKGIPGLESDE